MFIQLLVTSILLVIVVQSVVTDSPTRGMADIFTLPDEEPIYYDYDLNDPKILGKDVEGSGGAAHFDEYIDDDDDYDREELSKIINYVSNSSISTTMTSTLTTTTLINPWIKNAIEYVQQQNEKISTSTKTFSAFNDLDTSEFKDDHEEYVDELDDDAYYNELTIASKISTTSSTTTRFLIPTSQSSVVSNHTGPMRILFRYLARPSIGFGILAGLSFGILTSIILLICIIRRYHKRDKSHSSYTTGLIYPNHHGYSKSPQEFYA